MSYRLLGALLIIAGCGGFGMRLIISQKKQENLLHHFLSGVRFMERDLSYELTPLPELMHKAGKHTGGEIGILFRKMGEEMQAQVLTDPGGSMAKVLEEYSDFPRGIRMLLRKLGNGLGTFDLPGQLQNLRDLETECEGELQKLEEGRSVRYRSYETLGLCAGTALAILFF